MANVKLTDIMRPFDGSGSIVEWMEKFDLLVKLRDLKGAETILPMFLEGTALSVYSELSETQKQNLQSIKDSLMNAFSVNPFRAYEQFAKRVWRDEPVDVYMAELRKLARLAGISSDKLLLRAFVTGLPSVVSRELRATSGIESMALSTLVERARALMSELVEHPCAAAALRPTVSGARKGAVERPFIVKDERKCFGCGGPHLVRNCPKKDVIVKEVKCWTCGGVGHLSRVCPSGQGNSSKQGNWREGAFAPEAPSDKE